MIDSKKIIRQYLELTAIPGVSRKENQIIDYIKSFLDLRGFSYEQDNAGINFGGNSGNLICKINRASPLPNLKNL